MMDTALLRLPLRQANAPATLTVEETAKRLRISRNAAYAAVKIGEIPSLRIGRRILVPLAALEGLMRGK